MKTITQNQTSSTLFFRLLSASTLSLSLLFAANIQAKTEAQELRLVDLCETVQADKPHELRRKMKNLYISPRKIMADLKCNGMDPLEFASISGSEKVVNYLNKHTNHDQMLTKK